MQSDTTVAFRAAVFLKKAAIIIAILDQKHYTGSYVKFYLLVSATVFEAIN